MHTNKARKRWNSDPRWEHDCNHCVFVGRWYKFDLWFHPKWKNKIETVIARTSSEPGDYTSGIVFADQGPLKVALKRARELGWETE